MNSYRIRQRSRRVALFNALIVGLIVVAGCGTTAQPDPVAQTALTAKKSQVKHQPQGQNEQEVPQDSTRPLSKGDAINVDTQGRALLRFADALLVDVFHDTQLSIKGQVDPAASVLEMYILQGGATLTEVDLDRIAQKRVSLSTKWAVIDDLGTQFFSYYDPQTETTWVVVLKGVVEVHAPNAAVPAAQQTVRVPSGWQTWVEPRQPPLPPRPATRAAVGNRFPTLEQLTGGEYTDAGVLPSLQSFVPAQTTIRSGAVVDGTLTLSGSALEGGVTVTLANPRPDVVEVPPSVIVPAGSISQTLTLTARTVSQPTEVTIIAAYGDEQKPVTLTILPPLSVPRPTLTPTLTPTIIPTLTPRPTSSPSPAPRLADLTIAPAAVEGGGTAVGKVTLSEPAPAGGLNIRLVNNYPQIVKMPASVPIAANRQSANFEIKAANVRENTNVEIGAALGNQSLPASLTVLAPPRLLSFTLDPPVVARGTSTQGTITLSRTVGPGGIVIALGSASQEVVFPPTVTVEEGTDRVSFTIKPDPAGKQTTIPLAASYGDTTLNARLTVTPPTRPDLIVTLAEQAPDVICSGNPVICGVPVTFTVTNSSEVDVTTPFTVLVEADAVPPRTLVIEGLDAGASESFKETLRPGGNCYDPDCTLTVTVDLDNDVGEADEQNNLDTATYNG